MNLGGVVGALGRSLGLNGEDVDLSKRQHQRLVVFEGLGLVDRLSKHDSMAINCLNREFFHPPVFFGQFLADGYVFSKVFVVECFCVG